MARPGKNPNDPRTRYTHTAYDATYGGIAPERGVSGKNTLLAGTYQAAFQFVVPADVAGAQIAGDMPYGVWIHGLINHVALTSGAATLVLKGVGGGPDITLVTGADFDLTVAGPVVLDNPVWAPLTNTRPLQITVVGGTAGEKVVASVLATPAETAWK
jgi:hypothetical protein